MGSSSWIRLLGVVLLVVGCQFAEKAQGMIRHYKFNVVMKETKRLCWSKPIVTVNGQFPGPTIYAREDDTLLVKVVNHVSYNLSIHWHGVRQLRTCWSDGPAYITQCPIQPSRVYTYNFTLAGQRGTLLWHAHILWLRSTVHGALIILPKLGVPYPFPSPHREKVVLLAEWWKSDVEAVINEAIRSGLPPNVSDSHLINGHPGPVPSCPERGSTLKVKPGKAYMLRIINAALNDELFFKIACHKMMVVEVDATYVKPFTTDTILVAPGQTTTVLINTTDGTSGNYVMAVSPFMDSPVSVDNSTATAVLHYIGTPSNATTVPVETPPLDATSVATNFSNSLRSLNSRKHPTKVPMQVDHSLLFTIGIGVNPCKTCTGGARIVADINNVTFVMPKVSLLDAHYHNITGVFTDDFPAHPLTKFNYTGTSPLNTQTERGTRLYRLAYNSTVQVILQDTSMIAPETHPIHLHGSNFYVVGSGVGNFDEGEDEKGFNMVDPVERNTIGVPTGGWAAIRFRADNPGVWFMHCHLEVHTTWGLKMAFVVDDGDGPGETLLPPPFNLPAC
ncbi:hypothetical protein MLD38_008384 [Melastoma candidum]|uniref:Uncharacterized protein n=1 Tax=Melastoma candidum TaxID=119954 RepID=A0ACB9RX79_9MYRT|nr:hypothetical protein MLD38_008384 [Melastoma candidum]